MKKLQISKMPLWVEHYKNGIINMKNPVETKDVILNSDNAKNKLSDFLSGKNLVKKNVVTKNKTQTLQFEQFIDMEPNMTSHMDPLWVIMFILISL